MVMKKNLLIAAIAITALAGCTSDEYVGENTSPTTSNVAGAIQFVSNTPNITRERTGATAAGDLDYKFFVYAIKTMPDGPDEGDDPDLVNVFAQEAYSASSNTPYKVWYTTSTANSTISNTANWEYVGSGGTSGASYGETGHQVTLDAGVSQTVKYWDYAATNYIFTAYNNKSGGTVSNVNTSGFTFEGNASQFAGLYVADKLTIENKANPTSHGTADNKIGNAVKLSFRSGVAKVRLGIYETIPGYNVKNVNFKPTSPATFAETTTNAQLSGSFNGGSPSTSQSFTVSYGTDGRAQFATSTAATNNYVFGPFDTDGDPYLGVTSTAPTWANTDASSEYINVLPNTDHTGAMILNVDFDLYNTTTHETIHVEDAKAVVPAMYMTWNPNYAYTYLFKICDNTNGYTGPAASPRGLYPITFDAITIAAADASEGFITTVSTPSITTYQVGSVVDIEDNTAEPAISEHGITYAHANGPIYITVNTDGTLATLNASGTNVKLYTVAAETTEADLMLASGYAKTEVTSGDDAMTVITSAETPTNSSISFTANQTAKFTPTNGNTYAFEYTKAATYVAATGTFVAGTTYYTTNTGAAVVDTSEFVAGTTDVSSYFVVDTPAVKAYKVIKVVSGS